VTGANGGAPLLELNGIQSYYGLAHVLQGVGLEVRAGQVVALLGRNGAGKTTTLRSVMGLVSVRGGEVRFSGQSITRLPTYRIARLGIGYVPEDRRIFPGLSVAENLRLASLGARLDREREREAMARTWEIFPDLANMMGREAIRLSGGQQQMVAIARALLPQPPLLLIDEPTQGLAPIIARQILEKVVEIARGGVGVLLVEQNAVMALELADYAYVLDEGVIQASGPADRVAADPEVHQKYLAV
jgi:branched-chain amino acid transport system ATP-binding protein